MLQIEKLKFWRNIRGRVQLLQPGQHCVRQRLGQLLGRLGFSIFDVVGGKVPWWQLRRQLIRVCGAKKERVCVLVFFVNPGTDDSGGFGEEVMALLDLSPPPPLPLSAPGTADV